MALDLRVELPKNMERRLLSALDPKRMRWVEKEALNRTAGNVQKEAVRLVAQEMGIEPSKLAKRGRKIFSGSSGKFGTVAKGRRATARRLLTSVLGVGRPFNVVRFKGTPIKAGTRTAGVNHEAWGRSQTAMGVWQLVNMPGRPFVVPKGKTSRGVFGPGVRHVMDYPRIRGQLERTAREKFLEHFASRLRYAFGTRSHLR